MNKGTRVKAIKGLINKKYPERIGTVVGGSRTVGCVTVVWDGNKPSSKECIHLNFLEEIKP